MDWSMNEPTHDAWCRLLGAVGVASAVCAVALAGIGIAHFTGETEPVEVPVLLTVEVPVPVPYETIVEKPVVVEKRVEVPVETIVTEYVTDTVEVPTGLTAADVDAGYVSGYTDGRIEGEEFVTERFTIALATPCASEDGTECYWDARTMGNGSGTSFVNTGGVDYPLPID